MWSQTATTTTQTISITLTYGNHDVTGEPSYRAQTLQQEMKKLEKVLKRTKFRTEWFAEGIKYKAPARKHQQARFGFQQMCRIPCYRGVRPR